MCVGLYTPALLAANAKWGSMSEKNVEALAGLFDERAMFVHTGGNMTKEQELNVIKSGGIHYKHAEIEETSGLFIGETPILLSKLRLDAVIGGNEVTNPFTVTEVYVRQNGAWKGRASNRGFQATVMLAARCGAKILDIDTRVSVLRHL
jgi:hypothetical protein